MPTSADTLECEDFPLIVNEKKDLLWGAQVLVRKTGKYVVNSQHFPWDSEKSDLDTQDSMFSI